MTFILLASAVLWDRILGEPPVSIHPTVWMGRYIKTVWHLKKKHAPLPDFLWGGILLLSGIALFTVPLFLFISIIGSWSPALKILLSIPLLKVSFSIRYLLRSAREIRNALVEEDMEEARRLTAYHLVSRDTSGLNREELVSAVIESVAENITDSFISPVFFFLLLGLPGAWGYRFVNTSDAMIAYRTPEYEWGGKLTAWMDSSLNWLPARLTGISIVLAAFCLPGYSGKRSWQALRRCRSRTASPNAGWTMSAMAGALDITLEKKGEYLLEGGAEELTTRKIDNCLKITVLSLIVTLALVILMIQGGLWVLNTVV